MPCASVWSKYMGVVKHAYESEPLVDWYCHGIDPAVMDLMLMDEPQIKVAADIGVAWHVACVRSWERAKRASSTCMAVCRRG